jgi:hypothetical protein
MALCLCFLSALPIARAVEPITIPMTADHWQAKENAEFLKQLFFYHGLMRLNSGNAVLKRITFSDGTIRPDPSCPAFRACIQYAPQTHGVLLWDLFPQYQTRGALRDNGDKNT